MPVHAPRPVPRHPLQPVPASAGSPLPAAPLLAPVGSGHYGPSPLQRIPAPVGGGAPIQRQTVIQYGPLKKFKYEAPSGVSVEGDVATKMHAELDPADAKPGTDTKSSNAFNVLFDKLQECAPPKNWVRGHLLNHDLGGLAVYNNLFPITAHANSEHSYEVEQPIKALLSQGRKVTYDVDARKINEQDDTDPSGEFVCEAETTDLIGSKQIIAKTIQSLTNKVNFVRKSVKKGNKQKSKYASVHYGGVNNLLRDSLDKPEDNGDWEHVPGTAEVNNKAVPSSVLNPLDSGKWGGGLSRRVAPPVLPVSAAIQGPQILGPQLPAIKDTALQPLLLSPLMSQPQGGQKQVPQPPPQQFPVFKPFYLPPQPQIHQSQVPQPPPQQFPVFKPFYLPPQPQIHQSQVPQLPPQQFPLFKPFYLPPQPQPQIHQSQVPQPSPQQFQFFNPFQPQSQMYIPQGLQYPPQMFNQVLFPQQMYQSQAMQPSTSQTNMVDEAKGNGFGDMEIDDDNG